ncbi:MULTISPECIES: response regulator transcription factor [Sulfurimonas]|uniref:response regulator transcription factor n=1 Tax=Sulfurimonas TaxID=202746 RepID=UPI0012646E8C|nr:response regulator transcription factor [Sulfurimonas indica]
MKNKFLKTLRVLLVEDETNLSKLLKNAIGDNFFKFYVANDGQEGLELFKKITPDIVITDINMPKKSGLEMAKEIKAIESSVPIIILSAFSETEKLLNAIDVGVVKYLIKPFDPDELLEYIISLEKHFGMREIELRDAYIYNKTKKTLYKKNRYVPLSKKEKQFLELLLEYYEKEIYVVSDAIIKKSLWEDEVSDDRLRTFIRRFRAKTSKELIKNIKSEGYQIVIA